MSMVYAFACLVLPCMATLITIRWYLEYKEEPPCKKYYSLDDAKYSTGREIPKVVPTSYVRPEELPTPRPIMITTCGHSEIGTCWGVCESGFRWGACERCGITVDMQQYPYNTYTQ
jgi:hypothetical protein